MSINIHFIFSHSLPDYVNIVGITFQLSWDFFIFPEELSHSAIGETIMSILRY